MIKQTLLCLLLCVLACYVTAQQRCSGSPPSFNGVPCATTTNYNDGTMGACGCGYSSSNSPFDWANVDYTAAASQALFDNGGSSWCGQGCGKCYKLTPTGGAVPGQGAAPPNQNSIVVMVTNLCPHNGNEQWCAAVGGTNNYGYPVHFDLRNAVGQITSGLHWNNPEVTYQQVPCSTGNSLTPTDAQFATCQCGGGSDGSDGSDGGDGSGNVPAGFQWADGTNSWWVAFGLQANSVSMDCGRGFLGLTRAGWTINGKPVWIWANTGYQCAQTVTINNDGNQFSATRPN